MARAARRPGIGVAIRASGCNSVENGVTVLSAEDANSPPAATLRSRKTATPQAKIAGGFAAGLFMGEAR
jgi:hypothetical protein